jgi:ubiquinone/menaquinone biosynthesis C-methylase UbiE
MLGFPRRTIRLAFLPLGMMIVGCHRPSVRQGPEAAASSVPMSLAHDHAHPPVDCPLREAGVNPHALKPFEDVEKYISFLERPDRAVWQKPDAVVSALGLSGIETVADVGAGSGYFTFRFAKALPRGKVVATDVEPEMIRHIHHRAMTEGITNVQVVLGDPDDPKVPADARLVFVCDVLHHVKNRPVWLSNLHREAGAGAKVVVVEFKEGDLPEGPPASMKLPHDEVVRLMSTAGFSLSAENTALLPYQFVLTFEKR